MHEMTRNYETKGKETWRYIDYICAVIQLYAHMCLSGNTRAIKEVQGVGLNESHILCCICQDNERLVIHEKIKQSYMFLTRVLFIQNDPLSPGIEFKNRCYVWDKLSMKDRDAIKEDSFYDENNERDRNVENDFYEGLARKKRTQMDDPNNSMIVLRYE